MIKLNKTTQKAKRFIRAYQNSTIKGGKQKMELNVEIKNLTNEDIIYILSEGFKYPRWNKNNVVQVTNNLLNNEYTTIIDIKNVKYSISLYGLYRGIELFIKNGGGTNLYKYDLTDCDKIIQYALFGIIMY